MEEHFPWYHVLRDMSKKDPEGSLSMIWKRRRLRSSIECLSVESLDTVCLVLSVLAAAYLEGYALSLNEDIVRLDTPLNSREVEENIIRTLIGADESEGAVGL